MNKGRNDATFLGTHSEVLVGSENQAPKKTMMCMNEDQPFPGICTIFLLCQKAESRKVRQDALPNPMAIGVLLAPFFLLERQQKQRHWLLKPKLPCRNWLSSPPGSGDLLQRLLIYQQLEIYWSYPWIPVMTVTSFPSTYIILC